jgi:hypothetical protein
VRRLAKLPEKPRLSDQIISDQSPHSNLGPGKNLPGKSAAYISEGPSGTVAKEKKFGSRLGCAETIASCCRVALQEPGFVKKRFRPPTKTSTKYLPATAADISHATSQFQLFCEGHFRDLEAGIPLPDIGHSCQIIIDLIYSFWNS